MAIDYSNADAIAAIFREEAAPIFAANFHADTYVIAEDIEAADGYGGTTTARVERETGRCVLDRSNTQGGVKVASGIVLTESDYTAELPLESVLTTNHVITINGREFEVTDVQREGNAGMFTYAAINEKGTR